MGKSAEQFRFFLNRALERHGAVSEFCRKTGFSRNAVENWLSGESFPTLDSLEIIAEALKTTAFELLRPESSKSDSERRWERLESFFRQDAGLELKPVPKLSNDPIQMLINMYGVDRSTAIELEKTLQVHLVRLQKKSKKNVD